MSDQNTAERKRKNKKPRRWLRAIIWIVVIVAVIILTLILAAAISPQFNDVWEMMDFIFASVG